MKGLKHFWGSSSDDTLASRLIEAGCAQSASSTMDFQSIFYKKQEIINMGKKGL